MCYEIGCGKVGKPLSIVYAGKCKSGESQRTAGLASSTNPSTIPRLGMIYHAARVAKLENASDLGLRNHLVSKNIHCCGSARASYASCYGQ